MTANLTAPITWLHLSVTFWNVENLFDTIDDPAIRDDEFTPAGKLQWTPERLLHGLEAVRDRRVDEKTLDERVRRLLELVVRSGALDDPVALEEESVDRPEHQALAREAAGESAVLLRNEGGVLPLLRESLRRLAVVGPNAAVAQIQGGGSAGVTPHYAVTPLDGIRAACGEGVAVRRVEIF